MTTTNHDTTDEWTVGELRETEEYENWSDNLAHIESTRSIASVVGEASKDGAQAVELAAIYRLAELRKDDYDEKEDESEVATDAGVDDTRDEGQTVYVVRRDLSDRSDQLYGGAIEGVYSSREAAEAHAADIEAGWTDEYAEVFEQTVEDAYEQDEPRVMTDGGEAVFYTGDI